MSITRVYKQIESSFIPKKNRGHGKIIFGLAYLTYLLYN